MSPSDHGNDQDELARLVDVWHEAVDDVLQLLREIPEDQWTRATDLPGWSVHDVVAHLAHLESVLAGAPEETVRAPQAGHVRSLSGAYTEQGVHARRGRTPRELLAELEQSVAARYQALTEDPPQDPRGTPPTTPAGVPWDWRTLLSNRIVDVWMHEQDVRRAVHRSGGMESEAAGHTTGVFALGMAYVVAKKVGAPPGTTVVFELSDAGMSVPVEVGDDHRGRVVARPPAPTVTLTMPTEAFTLLAGGRKMPEELDVEVSGDEPLGQQVLGAMTVTW